MEHARKDRSWEHRPDVFGGIEDISEALVIREQGSFLLTNAEGNVPAGNRQGFGLYTRDTRHLSAYDFFLDGERPVLLLSTADSGFSLQQVVGNYRMTTEGVTVGRCTVELMRQLVLGDGLQEELRITNFNPFPVTLRPRYELGADFADIFEVRGHQRERYGQVLTPEVEGNCVTYRYLGVDGEMRVTRVAFDPLPAELTSSSAAYVVHLGARETKTIRVQTITEKGRVRPAAEPATRRISQTYTRWREGFTRIHTDNEIYNRVLGRSISDLRMLWRDGPGGRRFIAAGTPWFDALFGRDSIIVALQTLAFRPSIAADCLRIMAKYQGQSYDKFREEEPGKILHELREDELCRVGELPYERYYGSVDSTPLFLLLAAEYYNWTADIELLDELRPSLFAALDWVHRTMARSKDGFLEYETDSPTGLRNQGWKDSEDAICHADGSLCEGPIALPEVQSYIYAAFSMLPRALESLGAVREAERLRKESRRLRAAFNRVFWLGQRGIVALARDGEGRLAEVMSSNAGQALWGGLLPRNRASQVRDALMDNDMFTGWGIRTLARSAAFFNPNGYHVGTIWPHDNAIIIAGLKRNGFDSEVTELATALFDAATSFQSYRLPEVFGGQPRSPYQPPVPYPVACRPQAWAAGAMLHILQSMLGLVADAPRGKLYLVKPQLPYWLDHVYLEGLRVGRGSVSLAFRRERGRTKVQVSEARHIEVAQVGRWPSSVART